MSKSLLAAVAGAALIAGGGLAAAQQRMEVSPGGANGAQGSSQREPRGGVHERQSGAMQGHAQGRSTTIGEEGQRSGHSGTMQGQAQGRSGAIGENEHRTRHSGTMQGQTQGRSGAIEENERRSGQTGTMEGQTQGRSGPIGENERRTRHSGATQGQTQGRSGATEENEHRTRHSGATQDQTQGRSGAIEENEHRSGQSGAMRSQAQGRSGAVQGKEHRSGQSGAVQGSAQGRSAATALTADQKTKLRDTIDRGDIRRVDHVDFSLSVGIRVPRTASIYDVPETIVDIVPQYRGFKYIAVRDELAIIDPGTLEIVAVLPTQDSAEERSGRSVGSTALSPDQKTRLHGIITGGDIRRIDNADFALSVGTRVPNTVTFYDLPETIVDIVPEYRGDEYIVVGDQLVIIDPETLEILAVLPA